MLPENVYRPIFYHKVPMTLVFPIHRVLKRCAPSGLVALGLVVSKLTGLMPNYIFAYRLLSMIFAPINNALTSGVAWTSQVTWWMLPVAVLCWAVVPLTTALAYWFGYNRVSLGERLVYKKK